MELADVTSALTRVLDRIQKTSGLASPVLAPTSIPSKILPKFDSTVWPVATSWLAKELGIRIDNDVHVFGGKGNKPLLTIAESAGLVLAHFNKKAAMSVAAE